MYFFLDVDYARKYGIFSLTYNGITHVFTHATNSPINVDTESVYWSYSEISSAEYFTTDFDKLSDDLNPFKDYV